MEHPARSLHNLREMLLRLALELNSSCHFRQSRKSQRFAVAPSLSDCSFWLLLEVLLFSTAELCFQRLSHRDRDVGLDAKNVLEFAVVTLGPEMLIGRRANELHIDVHLIGGLLHAALDNVCNPKLTSDTGKLPGRAAYCCVEVREMTLSAPIFASRKAQMPGRPGR